MFAVDVTETMVDGSSKFLVALANETAMVATEIHIQLSRHATKHLHGSTEHEDGLRLQQHELTV